MGSSPPASASAVTGLVHRVGVSALLVEVPNQVRMNVPTIKPWAFFAGELPETGMIIS